MARAKDKEVPPNGPLRGRKPKPEVTGKDDLRVCYTCSGSGRHKGKTCGACLGKGGTSMRNI